MIRICSSMRFPRFSKVAPRISNSSRSQPAPRPSTARFFEKMAAVPRPRAISMG
jgi:hypothetical protein